MNYFRLLCLDKLCIQAHAEEETDFVFTLPNTDLCKDLNSSHNLELDENFYEEFIQSIEDGKVDSLAGKKLYADKYLLTLRKACQDNDTFICARVSSAFRSATEYIVNVQISEDKFILYTQCECASGKGPTAYCKHVLLVFEALEDFLKTKTYKTRQTCTEKLQTFHQVKKYTGSPVKAKNLNLPKVEKLKKNLANYDPRPKKLRKIENYYDFFRNTCINFAGTIKQTFPELQLFKPANFYSFYNDHDYFKLHAEDEFLKDMNISKITQEKIEEIEINTRGQSENKYWMHERNIRITSSNFGQVINSKNHEKTAKSLLNPQCLSHIPAIQHGKKFEVHAIKKAEKYIGTKIKKCGTFVSLSCPYLAASPDGIINDDTSIEVKCPYTARDKMISPATISFLVNGQDKVTTLDTTHPYYFQVQGQMFCANKKLCLFIVYTFKDILIIPIIRDDIFIQKMLVSLKDFYDNSFKVELLKKYLYKDF